MAADGTPGARLQPQFLGTGAPATAEDLNILGDHIAEMGNSMALSTADREAFESDGWEGLFCYDTDEDVLYRHDGSAWVDNDISDSGWVTLSTLGSGWAATTNHTPRIRRVGKQVFLFGAVTRSGTSGALADLATIPSGYRMAGSYTLVFVGASITSGGQGVELYMNVSDHKIQIASGYTTATLGSGVVVPLAGSWFVD